MRNGVAVLIFIVLNLLFASTAYADCVVTTTSVTDPKTGKKETQTQVTCWDDGGGESGVGSGWNPGEIIGGGGFDNGQYCAYLRLTKPESCLGPAPISGANYGDGSYSTGSALAAAIYNAVNNSSIQSSARNMLSNALAEHTSALANGQIPFSVANSNLIAGIQAACEYQAAYDRENPPMSPHAGGISPALRACLGTLARANGEAGNAVTFGGYISAWLQQQGIVLNEFGQTIINWFEPENSLRVKFELIEKQAKCNVWYREMSANGC